MAAVGVTGTSAANRLAEEADVVLAVGTRLQDFTTGSWALFKNGAKTVIGLNVQPFDAGKHRALPLVGDARESLKELEKAIAGWKAPAAWTEQREEGQGRVAEGRRQGHRRDQCRAAVGRAGDRRGAARAAAAA